MWQIILLTYLHTVSAVNSKCRVLSIGGGSDKGAYTAGAIIGLIENLPSGEAHWDVVIGNGDGALNAYVVAQQKLGDESSAASVLSDFWSKFTYSDFYDDWAGWLVTGLFFQTGLYDAKNMHTTVDNLGTGQLPRFIGVGTTDLITGGYVFFNNTNISFDIIKTGVKASVSKAGIFPYVPYRSWRLVDGSIKYSVDVLHGIDACNDLGYSDDQIVIDVVMNSGKTIEKVDAKNYKTLQVLLRYLSISSYNGAMQVVDNAKHDHELIQMRSVIFPSANLDDSFYPYDYSAESLKKMLDLGKTDAKTAVSADRLVEE